ncbi:uncharacterized protein LOC124133315 [Haliotis rufescens]|uniref:uncharacterized protein LOC124133315 n=1 Tax=Haliotis rufescens TaxID=6454 RepID=UPI001EB056F6|nr:uncharacterized protein LOC124133315 [Haliotis rufescens]
MLPNIFLLAISALGSGVKRDVSRSGSCSHGDIQRVERCLEVVYSVLDESPIICGDVTRAINCVTSTIERCPHIGGPLLLAEIDKIRPHLMEVCVETSPVPGDGETPVEPQDRGSPQRVEGSGVKREVSRSGRCSSNDTKRCLHRMHSFFDASTIMCGDVTRAINCLTSIIERCSNIDGGTSLADLNIIRLYLMGLCPRSK